MQGGMSAATRRQTTELVEQHTPLVKHLVNQLQTRVPRHVSREDLYAAGMVGLLEAARRFRPDRGVTFGTFAATRIRGAVIDELRSIDWASRSVRRRAREVGQTAEALTGALGRSPTDAEVATSLGCEVQEVATLAADLTRAAVVSITSLREDGDDGEAIAGAELSPEAWALRSETHTAVMDAVAALPDRLRHIVVACFFEGRSQRELASELGVTESRVSQLRSRALKLLREHLRATLPSAETAADPVAA